MGYTSFRFARHIGAQCSRQVSRPIHSSISGNQINRCVTRATYSSLSRPSSEGKSVIITGSSRGIGKAIALRLAADGYNVCISDLGANRAGCDEVAKEIRNMGRKACVAVADVRNREEVKGMIETSVRELGPLNTLSVGPFCYVLKPVIGFDRC